jgi:hypothetical protein
LSSASRPISSVRCWKYFESAYSFFGVGGNGQSTLMAVPGAIVTLGGAAPSTPKKLGCGALPREPPRWRCVGTSSAGSTRASSTQRSFAPFSNSTSNE